MKPSILLIYRNQNLATQFVIQLKNLGYDVRELFEEEIP